MIDEIFLRKMASRNAVFVQSNHQEYAKAVTCDDRDCTRKIIIWDHHQGQTTVQLRLTCWTTSRSWARMVSRNNSPRVKASVTITTTEIQPGTKRPNHFSYTSQDEDYVATKCHAGWDLPPTAPAMQHSPKQPPRALMFTGAAGVWDPNVRRLRTRLCALGDKECHQSSLSQKGAIQSEVYNQGLFKLPTWGMSNVTVHSIKAWLKNAEMMRTGYAIEYDMVWPPSCVQHWKL